jgi:subtilisin family serine protease
MKRENIAMLVLAALVLCGAFSVSAQQFVLAGSYNEVIVGFKGIPDLELVQQYGGVVHQVYSLIPAIYVSLPQATISMLKEKPNVAYIAGDNALSASGQVNWAADAVNASMAWSQSMGAGVKVAVLDTGVGPTRDLTVLGGYNFVGNNNNYSDDNGHGTMVAGIIACTANSSLGISGVAPVSQIFAVKMLDKNGDGSVNQAVEGIQWAVDNGMQIISMSWTLNDKNSALQNALQVAYNRGLLLVAAAGNTGDVSSSIWCPASFDSVIAVSGIRQDYTRLADSCFGPKIELTAPGEMVYSTWLNNQLGVGTGTSMAAPFVSGAAALIWSKNPSLTNVQVRAILDGTAVDLGSTGKDIFYGFGLVNASAAVLAAPSNLAVSFSYSPVVAYAAVQVNFDAAASFGEVNGYTTYAWDFGDGFSTHSYSPVTSHIFASSGSYSVSLVVNDTFGFSNSTVQTVSVQKDSVAPITSNNFDGLVHTTAFTIVLTAQDSQSGVAAIYYKINDGQIQNVSTSGQPWISAIGLNNKLEYWSTDRAGNTEEHKVLTDIKLDTSVASSQPTQSPTPTVKPTIDSTVKPTVDYTAMPSPTGEISTSPTSTNDVTIKSDGQELPLWLLYISILAVGIVVMSVVALWLRRK